MKSKRSLEGYLLIDNRHAPGVSREQAAACGKEVFGVCEQVVELPTLTCSHCHRQQIVQPLRTRDRPYCRKCDRYICDSCAVVAKVSGGDCVPMNQLLDGLQERAAQASSKSKRRI